MKTIQFNPSPLEVDFAKAIVDLKKEIVGKINGLNLGEVETHYQKDNPDIIFKLTDKDGIRHELLIRFIERVLEE